MILRKIKLTLDNYYAASVTRNLKRLFLENLTLQHLIQKIQVTSLIFSNFTSHFIKINL